MSGLSKVLVTGGAGFIGSHLVRELMGLGCSVVVLDDFCSGKAENLREFSGKDGFLLIKGDVRDKEAVGKAAHGVDGVVHLAALVGVGASVNDPGLTFDVNVQGSLNVLAEAVKKRVKRFVYASSAAVYGEENPVPLKENCLPKPVSPYGVSKAATETHCEAYARNHGLETFSLRFFNVYGPGQEFNPYSGVIMRFLGNALNHRPLVVYGNGEQARDFVHVDDAVRAIIGALEKGESAGESFNVCIGESTTINELAELVKTVTGENLEVRHDVERKSDINVSYGDPAKAEKELGFRAEMRLKEGIKLLVDGVEARNTKELN